MAQKSVVLSIVQILFFGGMLLAMWDLKSFCAAVQAGEGDRQGGGVD